MHGNVAVNKEIDKTAEVFKSISPRKEYGKVPKSNNATELKMIIYEQITKIENLEAKDKTNVGKL